MAVIYLADRDATYRGALAQALREGGPEVVEFASGAELYECALASNPDLIVTETELEAMDGFQVFSALQRQRPGKPLAVVFVTAFDHPRVAEICKERGALGYIGKRRPLSDIVEELSTLIAERDPLQERKLAGALVWLQSHGKSGRLDVEADGGSGYVLLREGKVLEARWDSLEGDDALMLFAEGLGEVRFRFAGEPESAKVAPAGEAESAKVAPAAPAERAPLAAPAEVSLKPASLGVLTAVRRRLERERGKRRWKALRTPPGQGVLLGFGTAVALLLVVGVGLPALSGLLRQFGNGDELEVLEPSSQAASTPAAPGSLPEQTRPSGETWRAKEAPPVRQLADGIPADLPQATAPRTERPAPRAVAPPDEAAAPESPPARVSAAPQVRQPSQPAKPTATPRGQTPRPEIPAAAPRATETDDEDEKLAPVAERVAQAVTFESRAANADKAGGAREIPLRKLEEVPSDHAAPAALGFEGPQPSGPTAEGSQPSAEAPLNAVEAKPGADDLDALRGRPQVVPVDSRPFLKSPLRVRYSRSLAERKIKGTVTLWVLVNEAGGVEEVSVVRSSGYADLDGAAMEAVRQAAYNPARRDDVAVPAWVQQQVLGLCCRSEPPAR